MRLHRPKNGQYTKKHIARQQKGKNHPDAGPEKIPGVIFSRKEVFQPHLPVRLPCYDLALVTDFALGRSLR